MVEEVEKEIKLNGRQKLFADYYIGEARQNATKAAKMAGYSEATAYSIGSRLLKNVEVSAYIDERLKELTLSANVVLVRLTEIANGKVTDVLDENGKFDLQSARENGKDGLIKKLKVKKTSKQVDRFTDETEDEKEVFETSLIFEETEFEMYSAHEALRDLGKYHKLFTDRTEVEHSGGLALDVTAAIDSVYGEKEKKEDEHNNE